MNGHLQTQFVRHRHNGPQEMEEVLPEPGRVNVLIGFQGIKDLFFRKPLLATGKPKKHISVQGFLFFLRHGLKPLPGFFLFLF